MRPVTYQPFRSLQYEVNHMFEDVFGRLPVRERHASHYYITKYK